jgi:hypothetical protein
MLGKLIPSNARRLPVGQPLAFNAFYNLDHPLAVADVPMIPAEAEFPGVLGQVLAADVMPSANDATL